MTRQIINHSGSGALSDAERLRFARQIIVPGIGLEGQIRLKKASVLIVGAGGLGSPAALYLAAAGVGRLGIADPDVVDVSNLQRQIIHFTSDIGTTKVESARRKLADINPFLRIDIFDEPLKAANALELVRGYDVVVDGSDNYPARYVINDSCVLLKKPMVYGSVQHVFGQVSVFHGRKGPCFRCLMPVPPPPGSAPGCAEQGVLGVVPGVIGTLQAAEAIKIILGLGTPLVGRLLFYDSLAASFDLIDVAKNPACPACGLNPSISAPADYEELCGNASPEHRSGDVLEWAAPVGSISVRELKRCLKSGERPLFLEIQEPGQVDEIYDGGALRIPKNEIMSRISEIPRDREVIVLCRIGIQSRELIRELRGLGFDNLINLEGGTIAWKYGIEVVP
jgi:adenylyltransferase/sulfurtransferase